MRTGFFKTVSLASVAILSIGAQGATVFSEDFSGGNPTSSTSYSLIADGSYSLPGQYRVISNPATDFANSYVSYFDHTTGAAQGAMLFFDGAGSPIAIWSQAASLLADASYSFVFYSSAGGAMSPPLLDLLVDGVSTGGSISTTSGAWTEYSYVYVPTTSGTHTFSIVDTNLEPLGNDGGLDDISLSPATVAAVPEPSAYALMVAGLVAVGTLRRRRS